MNKVALVTMGKKLLGDNLFLCSVFDLEPSGILVHAYNQADSREYTLAVSERDLAAGGFNRTNDKLYALLDTMQLRPTAGVMLLQSTCPEISDAKIPMTASDAQEAIKKTNAVLVEGLVELCKVKPVGLDAVQWLGEWLLQNNPNKPRVDLAEE